MDTVSPRTGTRPITGTILHTAITITITITSTSAECAAG